MQTNHSFAAIQHNFIAHLQAYDDNRDALEKKIDTRKKQLERLQARLKKIHCPRWTEELLRPVLEEIKKHFPEWHCDDERLNPMGLGCRVSVFFMKKGLPPSADVWSEENSVYITFLPGKLDNGELLYETGETNSNYQPGTIGEINGFNNVAKPLENIHEVVAFLNAQIDPKEFLQ